MLLTMIAFERKCDRPNYRSRSLALEHLIVADLKLRSQIFSKTSATKDLPPEVPNRAVTLALLTRPDRAMWRSPLYGDIS